MTLETAEKEMKRLLQQHKITNDTHKAMFLNLLVSVDDNARKETKMSRANG